MLIHMELSRILIRETEDAHIVELREQGGERVFPIVIGLHEAAAIERRLMGQKPPRPQTHELLADVIDHLGYRLSRVVVNDLRHDNFGNGTFYARLKLRAKSDDAGDWEDGDMAGDLDEDDDESDPAVIDVDSRPSDAIALGVANDVPIYVAEHVLEEVCRAE